MDRSLGFAWALLATMALAACSSQPSKSVNYAPIAVEYPATDSVDVVDDYHGTQVPDPYRWLENDTAPEVEAWVDKQIETTESYLSQVPFRQAFQRRLKTLMDYPKYSRPFLEGNRLFFFKNDGLQNQSPLYVQTGADTTPKVFFDPNSLAEDGTVALTALDFSPDHSKVVMGLSESGSDWRTFYVKDVETGDWLADTLKWIKFGGVAWKGDGFFYTRYPEPEKGAEFLAKSESPYICYHKLGSEQAEDVVIFEAEKPQQYLGVQVTEDGGYLVLTISEGTSGNQMHYLRLPADDLFNPRAVAGARFVPVFTDMQYDYDLVDAHEDHLLVRTNWGAPKQRVVKVPADGLVHEADDIEDVIAEHPTDVISYVSTAGGHLFVNYMSDAHTRIAQYTYEGKHQRDLDLPALGSASAPSGYRADSVSYFTFTSFTYAPTIYQIDLKTGEVSQFRASEAKVDPEAYVTKQVKVTSKDGTEVPMFIVHKKGLELDGKNPTLLYGYGGFNISLTPSFDPTRLALLEQGGVFAMPNLRGGGEYGEAWHHAGWRDKKQNVFDDFIAAAEYLIDSGYTSREKLGIYGGSNGGLLVGACMTQRPDLFAVAIPRVGVLDMLRYHKFTVGWGWVVEYGSSDEEKDFRNLYTYSPLHNLKPGTNYPATLIMTADHDDRVVPAHSFKFGAALQAVQAGQDPVLLRIEKSAGHGAGTPTSKVIDQTADLFSFLFYNTNSPVKLEGYDPSTAKVVDTTPADNAPEAGH